MSDESPNLAATRSEMIQSSRTWSPLNLVAGAVAVASETEPLVYVERRGDELRWSLATKGGGCPLLRISARFLGVDYRRIYVGFRTLPNGTTILCEDPANIDIPDKWAVLKLTGRSRPLRQREEFGPPWDEVILSGSRSRWPGGCKGWVTAPTSEFIVAVSP